MEPTNLTGITLSLNLEPYTNLWVPLNDTSPEALQEIDTKIELAKQILAKHSHINGVSVEERPAHPEANSPQVPTSTTDTIGGELKVNFGETHSIQISKYVKADDSGKYTYYVYEVIENGVLKTFKASKKLHEALSLLSIGESVNIYKEKITNSQGREYQTYRVVKADGTQVL